MIKLTAQKAREKIMEYRRNFDMTKVYHWIEKRASKGYSYIEITVNENELRPIIKDLEINGYYVSINHRDHETFDLTIRWLNEKKER
jgi:hypothetical protein